MIVTLDTFHFEMSELNALAAQNAAESKKRKREGGAKRRRERVRDMKRRKHFREKWKKKNGENLFR